jgi:beta-carotene ketolase (CrtO type)
LIAQGTGGVSMETYDVVIIGAGHNGLVCAAYLLKAGYTVLLLERHSRPGGAATTVEIMPEQAPGFKFNLCAIDHEFIHLGPVVEELELHKYGLEYLFCDPVVFCPHPDGKYFLAHHSLEETCKEIARFSNSDAQQYAQFIQFWHQVVNAMTPLFNAAPAALFDIAGNYDLAKLQSLISVTMPPSRALDMLRTMLISPTDLLDEWFDSEFLKAPLARLAAELGVPPSQKNNGIGAMMMAMRHHPGMARPRGGTGALVEALVKLVQAWGGVILTEQPVKQVLVEDGRAIGVRVGNGQEYRARRGVISNIDAQRLFLDLIDPAEVDASDPLLRQRLKRKIINNNESILKVDCALSEPPCFRAYNPSDRLLIGSVLIADSVNHVEAAHALPQMGQIPDRDPSLYVVVPSVLDPSLAPAGQHTLWIEFFAPYQIAGAEGTGLNGTGWTEPLKQQVADRIIDKLADYAPNLKASILARRVESPAELADRLGSRKGNCYHIDMTLDQMVFLRPLPELANYKTPISQLYLTGAGTHPGGSISGMPGRNCAKVFLRQQQSWDQTLRETGNRLKGLLKIPKG